MRFLAPFTGVPALEIVPIMEQAKSPLRDGAALAFALFFPTVLSLVAFVVLDEPEQRANPALLTAFSVGKCVQFLFPILYVWWFYRAEIRLARPNRAGLLLGGGFGLLVGVAMFALYFAWVRHIPAVAEKTPQMIYDRLRQFGEHDVERGQVMLDMMRAMRQREIFRYAQDDRRGIAIGPRSSRALRSMSAVQ